MNKTQLLTKYYYNISTAFILSLLFANIFAVKIIDFWGYTLLDAGTIIFPLLYVMNDILTEIYGFYESRKVIVTALLINLLFNVLAYIVAILPHSPSGISQEAFNQVFLTTPRIFFASMVSYLIGEFSNSLLLSYGKSKFEGKFFVLRALFSTFIGSLLDSVLFCYIAFGEYITMDELTNMVITLALVKVFIEFVTMPITSRVVSYMKMLS